MIIRLYQTLDDENVINKTMELKHTYPITLKDRTDIITPNILLNDKNEVDFNEVNYCYISEFDRYYFVRTVENLTNHLWSIELECDVLESFKDEILTSKGFVTKQRNYNPYYDSSYKSEVRKEVDLYESDTELTEGKTILLTTIGGV